MRLDSYLSEAGLARSRTHAKNLIIVGKVSVNGKIAQKASDDVSSADNIEVDFSEDYSSLGGIKLKRALEYFKLDPAGKICIDIGASNGGFTDVMLKGGAKKVFCVDIGECALPPEMCLDERVYVKDRLNARYLTFEDIGIKADLISVDVSFISLKLVIPALIQYMHSDSVLVALIKPQFEVGPKYLPKSGIVRNTKAIEKAIGDVTAFASALGLKCLGTTSAPHPFPDKNREYLAAFRLGEGMTE